MSSNRFEDEFTVHVISSASMDIFQENTLANFRNFLLMKLISQETGEWLWVKSFFQQKLNT